MDNSLLKSKKVKESIGAYVNSLKLNPNDQATKYNLSYALDMLKNQNKNQKNKNDKNNKNQQNKKDQNKNNTTRIRRTRINRIRISRTRTSRIKISRTSRNKIRISKISLKIKYQSSRHRQF